MYKSFKCKKCKKWFNQEHCDDNEANDEKCAQLLSKKCEINHKDNNVEEWIPSSNYMNTNNQKIIRDLNVQFIIKSFIEKIFSDKKIFGQIKEDKLKISILKNCLLFFYYFSLKNFDNSKILLEGIIFLKKNS